MGLVRGALVDPALDELHLRRRETVVRRHELEIILGADSQVELARGRVSGGDGAVAATILEGALPGIEPQVGIALVRVGAVAGEALVGEEGEDVAVEVDGLVFLRRRGSGRAQAAQPCHGHRHYPECR